VSGFVAVLLILAVITAGFLFSDLKGGM